MALALAGCNIYCFRPMKPASVKISETGDCITIDPAALCIRLPYLSAGRKVGCPDGVLPGLRSLWPGCSGFEAGAAWLPPDYPHAEAVADAILRELGEMSLADVERMRLLCANSAIGEEIGLRDEMGSLGAFAVDGQASGGQGRTLWLEHAQKTLLWLLALEENLARIEQLASACDRAGLELTACLHENPEQVAGVETDDAFAMLPSWKICVTNALPFIPAQVPILAEGEMGRELEEYFEFADAPELGSGFRAARAAISQVPGPWRHAGMAFGGNVYGCPRIWIAWRDI